MSAVATRLHAPPVPTVQRSLRVGAATDPLEVEADALADAVLRMPLSEAPSAVLQRCAGGSAADDLVQRCPGGCPGEEELRRQPLEDDDEEELRRQAVDDRDDELRRRPTGDRGGVVQADGGGLAVDAATAGRLDAARGGGATLPAASRGFFEPRFGADFSAVRVHADDRAAGLAATVNARAFTVGRDVFFGAGEYRPGTAGGDRLLAHELAHTVQQDATGTVRRRVAADRVTCADARPGSPILTRIGTDDPVGVLSGVDARAIDMLDTAIDTLTHGRGAIRGGAQPGWPTIGDVTAVALRDRLGLDPSDPAVWTGDEARSVRTVIRRLQGARRHLTSGWLRYQCMGSPSVSSHASAGCTGADCTGNTFAVTCPPSNLVVLCAPFWSAGPDEQALTLLHEALHIFFGFLGDTGQFGNAGCYEQLVADLHGLGDQGVC